MSALRFFSGTKIGADSTAGAGWPRQGFAPLERSAQPLAPPCARCLRRLSARAKTAMKVCARAKEKIMRLSKTLLILVSALLVVCPALAEQQPTIEHRLLAETISLTANPATNPQLQIWRDQIPDLLKFQKHLQTQPSMHNVPLVAEVFTVTVESQGHTYIVSAINNNCSNTGLPNSRFCPARLVELRDGGTRLISELPNFVVSSLRGVKGYDAASNAQKQYQTIVSLNPTTRTLSFFDVYDGVLSDMNLTVPLN
jgi:phage tail protein X